MNAIPQQPFEGKPPTSIFFVMSYATLDNDNSLITILMYKGGLSKSNYVGAYTSELEPTDNLEHSLAKIFVDAYAKLEKDNVGYTHVVHVLADKKAEEVYVPILEAAFKDIPEDLNMVNYSAIKEKAKSMKETINKFYLISYTEEDEDNRACLGVDIYFDDISATSNLSSGRTALGPNPDLTEEMRILAQSHIFDIEFGAEDPDQVVNHYYIMADATARNALEAPIRECYAKLKVEPNIVLISHYHEFKELFREMFSPYGRT